MRDIFIKEVVIIVEEKFKRGFLSYDVIFKSLFINNENILAKMVSDITGIDYEILKDNVVLETNELPVNRRNEKFKRCDFILKIGEDNIINLEINRNSYTGLVVKNLSYLFQLFSTAFKKGEGYNDNLVVMQINLNCFGSDDNIVKPLSKYHIREDEDNRLYSKNVTIHTLCE